MPDMCGLGGDLFVLLRRADGTASCVTGAGPLPREGLPAADEGRRAALALVPGVPAALEALRPLLRLDFPTLLAPAIRAAEWGFAPHPLLARKLDGLPVEDGFKRALLAG